MSAGDGSDGPDRSPVRPYALTGGRTARSSLPPETVIVADGRAPIAPHPPEAAQIVERCRPWSSVAELSAHLRLPLGVVRVLIEDLADSRVVRLYRPSPAGEGTDQLERALRELRKRI